MLFKRPDIFRPPSEADDYFLPLTSGCSNNSCAFCSFFGSKLQFRELNEVKKEIDALVSFLKSGLTVPGMPHIMYAIASQWDGRRVFLQDGDALVYPYPKLKEALEHLNTRFPELERIAAYATPQDVLRHTTEELKTLKELKLGILYMGVESGDDGILRDIGKGVNSSQLLEAGRRAKQADITLSATVILGLGGIEKSTQHVEATAKLLTEIDPDFGGALTLTFVPGTPLYDDLQTGKFTPISPFNSLQELRAIVGNSTFTNCFFSSMHASNYLSVRGRLPGDKRKMLTELDYVLSRKDPDLLKPEFLRGL